MLNTSAIRYSIAALFVAVYITLGYVFQLKTQAYLFIGIPLTLGFQYFVAKQPIHKLWLRDEPKFSLTKQGWLIAVCLMLFPTYKIISSIITNHITFVSLGYNIASFLGAFAAGYAFSKFTKKTFKDLLLCAGIVLIIKGISFAVILIWVKPGEWPDGITFITSLLMYIPIAFIVEEVVFRGMLDTYVYPSQKPIGSWPAIFISMLWALWHLPLSNSNENIIFISVAMLINTAIWGLSLSVFWRRSGNLGVPVFSHAFIDAIRDALPH